MHRRSSATVFAALVLVCAVVASPEGDSTGLNPNPGPLPRPPSGPKKPGPPPLNANGKQPPSGPQKPGPPPPNANGEQPPSGPQKPGPPPPNAIGEQAPSINVNELLEASQINVTAVTATLTESLQGYITDAVTAVDEAIRNAFQRSLNLVLQAAKYFVELAKSSLSALGLGSEAGGVIDGPTQGRSSVETEAHVAELARRLDTRALYRKVARLASESGASRRAAIALRKLSAFLGASTSA